MERYKVRAAPNLSDETGLTYFAVEGPRINEFEHMNKVAQALELLLNAAETYARGD